MPDSDLPAFMPFGDFQIWFKGLMSNLCGQACPGTLTMPSRKHLNSQAGMRELHSDHAHTLPCDKLFLTCGVTSSKM